SVSVNVLGSYIITYVATDPSGNSATNTRTVVVRDTIGPVITITGASSVNVECHTSYSDAGASANDSCAGPVAVSTSGSVSVNVLGNYTITYTSDDGNGNTNTATRTVHVIDTTLPVITLNGPNS